jgi:hypothetical protein
MLKTDRLAIEIILIGEQQRAVEVAVNSTQPIQLQPEIMTVSSANSPPKNSWTD